MNIRRSSGKDCEAIRQLINDMEQKTLPVTEFNRIYEAQLHDDNFLCLVCEVENQVIGVINLRMDWQLHHAARICEIMEFAVCQEYRNKGIGKNMFEKACKEAQKAGCVQIEVACNQLRKRTHCFYERMGMHNFHYKFSLDFSADANAENQLGK